MIKDSDKLNEKEDKKKLKPIKLIEKIFEINKIKIYIHFLSCIKIFDVSVDTYVRNYIYAIIVIRK